MLLFRVPSRRRRSREAPSKHAQRKGNKLARTGRESSPGPFTGNPCGPRSRQKSKKIEFVRACAIETHFNIKSPTHFARACAIETHFNIKQKHESAVNTTQNARGQKSPTHFVRACAVKTHFDIKQEHESAVNTTQNARGQSGHLNLAPRPFLLP